MSITLSVGNTTLPTDPMATKELPTDLAVVLELLPEIEGYLATTLAKVPPALAKTTFEVKGAGGSWTPGGGPVKFGLSEGLTGSFEILTQGTLVSYTDDLDNPGPKSVEVPPSSAYVKLTLGITAQVTGGATIPYGAFSIKPSLDASGNFQVVFCKEFQPGTLLKDALSQCLQSLVLPLHYQTLAPGHLADGDLLLFTVSGKLNLALGAFTGLDKVFQASESLASLTSFASPFLTLTAQAKPQLTAGANLNLGYQIANTFEILLEGVGQTARMHVYLARTVTDSASLDLGLTVNLNANAEAALNVDDVVSSVVARMGGSSATGQFIGAVLSSDGATGQIQSYLKEVNDKIASWLKNGNGLDASIKAAYQRGDSRVILAGFQLDPAAPDFPEAWKACLGGDFMTALGMKAVTLEVGSGTSLSYQRSTQFDFHLFNLLNYTTLDALTNKLTLAYAGNNLFHLKAKSEWDLDYAWLGTKRDFDVYFTALADVGPTGQVSNPSIDLHINLTVQNDPDAGGRVADLLNAFGGAPCGTFAQAMHAYLHGRPTGSVQLQVVVPRSSFANLQCDPCTPDGPTTASTSNDSSNWAAFAQAEDDLKGWVLWEPAIGTPNDLAIYRSYEGWQDLNEMEVHGSVGGGVANRRQTGTLDSTVWPPNFPLQDLGNSGRRSEVIQAMQSGQCFMNFCAALCDLASLTDLQAIPTSWTLLAKAMDYAIKTCSSGTKDAIRPTALALLRLSGGSVQQVSGPAPGAAPTMNFAVTVSF